MNRRRWPSQRCDFGEVSNLQLMFARAALAQGSTLRQAAAAVGVHAAELDLVLWRNIGRSRP